VLGYTDVKEVKNMADAYIAGHSPKFTTPEKYIKAKLKILRRDFCVRPTEEEIAHLKTLTTEIGIDNACLGIINRHWDN
jgi:hypothetical protein